MPLPQMPSDPEIYLETVQSIFARMARAKWISDPNPPDSDQWWKNLTDLGLQKVGNFSDGLIRAAPSVFKAENLSALTADSVKQPTFLESLPVFLQMLKIRMELEPPPFSQDESGTLIAMFYYFAREHGKEIISPSSSYRPPPI